MVKKLTSQSSSHPLPLPWLLSIASKVFLPSWHEKAYPFPCPCLFPCPFLFLCPCVFFFCEGLLVYRRISYASCPRRNVFAYAYGLSLHLMHRLALRLSLPHSSVFTKNQSENALRYREKEEGGERRQVGVIITNLADSSSAFRNFFLRLILDREGSSQEVAAELESNRSVMVYG